MFGLFGSAQLDIAIEATPVHSPVLPGTPIAVTIRLQAPKAVKTRSVRAGLVCLHRYQVIDESVDTDGDTHTSHKWRVDETWISEVQLASGEVSAGTHRYAFTWCVPADAAPSYAGTLAEVRWLVKVVADRALARDTTGEQLLQVERSADAPREAEAIHTTGTAHQPVSMALQLPQTTFVPGETIHGTLLLQPSHALEARRIRLELVRQERVSAGDRPNTREIQVQRVELAGATTLQPGVPTAHTFALSVPDSGCPSYQIAASSATWMLKAVIDRPFKADLCLHQPLTIATIRHAGDARG